MWSSPVLYKDPLWLVELSSQSFIHFHSRHHGPRAVLGVRETDTTKTMVLGDFPGGPVVKTWPSNAGGVGSVPGQGLKIPYALQPRN